MTPERRQEIRVRLDKITPPPWENVGALGVEQVKSGGPICAVGDAYPRGDNHPLENMVFIAHAPTDISDLLAENDALTAEIATLKAHLKAVVEAGEAVTGGESDPNNLQSDVYVRKMVGLTAWKALRSALDKARGAV